MGRYIKAKFELHLKNPNREEGRYVYLISPSFTPTDVLLFGIEKLKTLFYERKEERGNINSKEWLDSEIWNIDMRRVWQSRGNGVATGGHGPVWPVANWYSTPVPFYKGRFMHVSSQNICSPWKQPIHHSEGPWLCHDVFPLEWTLCSHFCHLE